MQLAVNVEVVTQSHEVAAELFAETILMEANGCQGSNKLLLRRVVIDFPSRQVYSSFTTFRCYAQQESELLPHRSTTAACVRVKHIRTYVLIRFSGKALSLSVVHQKSMYYW